MYWPLFLVVGGLAVLWLTWRVKHRRMIKMAQKVPGPPTIPLIGNAHQFMCQPEELITVIKSLVADYGDVVTFWLGPDLNYVISNPDDAKILLTNSKTSFKGPQYKYMADVLGGGILSGSGPQWRKHRKIATPNYGKRAIESYTDVFNKEIDQLLETLRKMGKEHLNIYKFIVQQTSYIVCQTLMGLTKEQTVKLPHFDEVVIKSPGMYYVVFNRMTKWYLQIDPYFWITNLYQQQKHFIKIIDDMSSQIIKHRVDILNTLEDENKVLDDSEIDSKANTQLSVIDRFILSQELNKEDLLKETFTVFTSVKTLMGLTKEQTVKLPHFDEVVIKSPGMYYVVFNRMTKWYLQIDPYFWITNLYQQQKHFIKIIDDMSSQIIKHRVDILNTLEDENKVLDDSEIDSKANTQLSVIDRFILSQELNKEDLLKETFTVFTSSQEATAKIASFLILMMAYHPKCQEKLYAEIKRVIGDKDRPVTDKDLKDMPYLEMVFKEVVRLFPIGVMLQRTVIEDIDISTCTLPAGCSFVVPIFNMHRDPRFWDQPEAFDPERFTPENMKKRNPNCYVPFSLGPMDCLGRYFGAKLVKTMSVRILREFEVTSLETYKDLRLIMAISTVSLNGYPVFLHPRKT